MPPTAQEGVKNFETPYFTRFFWACYQALPKSVQKLANKNFKLLKVNLHHPSLHFKKIGKYRTVRIGLYYRGIAIEVSDGLLWFWIGAHSEYDKVLGQQITAPDQKADHFLASEFYR